MDSPSQRQEKRVAKRLGGKVQPASGAGWMKKGDVSTDRFLVECKTTAARSYRLALDTILKIEREACLENKDFALFVEISGREVVVVDPSTFYALAEVS